MLNQEACERSNPTSTTAMSTPSVANGTTACSSALQTPSPERTSSRRTSLWPTPGYPRQPWNANGFHMPLTLNTDVKTGAQAVSHQRQSSWTASPIDSASPKSPRHRITNSQSTISSYNSSLSNSISHSRLSSLSTTDSCSWPQSIPQLTTELAGGGLYYDNNLDSAVSGRSVGDYFSEKQSGRDGGVSPTTIQEEPPMREGRRPGSPSDAMLISRGAQSSDRMSPRDMNNPDLKLSNSFLSLPDPTKSHKRAVSAPDFAGAHAVVTSQPTPPPQQGDRRSSYMMESLGAPALLPLDKDEIKCLYTDKCETGSSLRKAISHIFGRNKLCTRMIPDYVWVHYCRKHYQRTRYRNSEEYARVSVQLVLRQIRQIQQWSDENRAANKSGVVIDWSLQMRKREKNRLEKEASSNGRKRRRDDSDDEDDSYDESANHATGSQSTAVPDWLVKECDISYDTEKIMEIVGKLQKWVVENKRSQIPDIEILPNITTDSTEPKARAPVKRKTSTAGHQRSQTAVYGHQRNSLSVQHHAHRGSLPQVPERIAPANTGYSQHASIPFRPATWVYEDYSRAVVPRTPQYAASYTNRLPTLQGLQPSASSHLDASQNYHLDHRRTFHQRAQSEAGMLTQDAQFTFRAPGPYHSQTTYQPESMGPYSSYTTNYHGSIAGPPDYYDNANQTYEFGADPRQETRSVWNSPQEAHQGPYSMPMPRHVRHQSTSAVRQSTPQMSYTPRLQDSPREY